MTDLSFDFWYPTAVSRPYMPDPKGEFEAILRDLEAVGFKPNPQSAIWNPTYLDAEEIGKYPALAHRLELRLAGHRQLPVHGVLRVPRQRHEPNPEFANKNDAMNAAMLAALASSR